MADLARGMRRQRRAADWLPGFRAAVIARMGSDVPRPVDAERK
jgi:hypothetical protein